MNSAGVKAQINPPTNLTPGIICPSRHVQIISYEGKFLRRFGQDILRGPWGIATAMRSIYVTDRDLHALFRFCMKDYKLIGRVGIRGSGKGQLCYPRGVSVDYNGEVYVADYDNNRISIYSTVFIISYVYQPISITYS